MKSIYLKMMLPMLLATGFANANVSSLTQTDPVDLPAIDTENLFPKYDNRVQFGVSRSHLTTAGVFYERLKLQSMYVGVGAVAFKQGVGIEALGGYNFLLSPKDRITPVAGLVYHQEKSDRALYPVIGVVYEHAFTDRLRLGTNFKALVSENLAFYLGVPFTVQIDKQKRWEFEVQPYITHVETWFFSANSTGVQAAIGYRF